MEEYESAEQKMWNFLRPAAEVAGQFLGCFARAYYAAVAGFFRIPTTIRKVRNKQSLLTRVNSEIIELQLSESGVFPVASGFLMGAAVGVCTDVFYGGYSAVNCIKTVFLLQSG